MESRYILGFIILFISKNLLLCKIMSYESEKIEGDAGIFNGLESKEKEELKLTLYTRRNEEKLKREEREEEMIKEGYPAHTDNKMEIELVDIENLNDEEFLLFKRLLELEEKDATTNDINEYENTLKEYHEELAVYLKEENKKENHDILEDPRENFYAWLQNKFAKVQLDEFRRNKKVT